MITRRVSVRLTDPEVLERAETALDLAQRIESERLELKLHARQVRERCTALDEKARPLRDAVRLRAELRDVECRLVDGELVRIDTGEVVGRPTDEERQRSLFEAVS